MPLIMNILAKIVIFGDYLLKLRSTSKFVKWTLHDIFCVPLMDSGDFVQINMTRASDMSEISDFLC